MKEKIKNIMNNIKSKLKGLMYKINGLSDKNKIIILVVILILVVGLTIFFVIRNHNNNKLILEEEKPVVEKIEINNTINEISVVSSRIEKLGRVSSIYVKVKNNTDSIIDKSDLKLTIKDKDDNILLTSYIKEFNDFKVSEEREFQVSTESDITAASTYTVEKVK